MSKYFNALAVAVLGIAMLMGAASAQSTIGGCYIGEDYQELDVTSLPLAVDLAKLPSAVYHDGGSMTVKSGNSWKITCTESGTGADGKMSLDTSNVLDDGLTIKVGSTDYVLDADGVDVASGSATSCPDVLGSTVTAISVEPDYWQTIDTVNDLSKKAGTYTISIVYALQQTA